MTDTKNTETTFAMLKPDGMLIPTVREYIIGKYIDDGLEIIATSLLIPSEEQLEQHYAEHIGKSWLPSTIAYIRGEGEEFEEYVEQILKKDHKELKPYRGNLAMLVRGQNAITRVRELNGPTNPDTARLQNPDSIRARFGTCYKNGIYNIVHASANAKDAAREGKLYFPE